MADNFFYEKSVLLFLQLFFAWFLCPLMMLRSSLPEWRLGCVLELWEFSALKKINKCLGLDFFSLFYNGNFLLASNQGLPVQEKWIYDEERGFWRLPWLGVVITCLNGVLPRMNPGKQTLLYESSYCSTEVQWYCPVCLSGKFLSTGWTMEISRCDINKKGYSCVNKSNYVAVTKLITKHLT